MDEAEAFLRGKSRAVMARMSAEMQSASDDMEFERVMARSALDVAVQYAKAMGFNVIAVDVADDKLQLAKELGADKVINAAKREAKCKNTQGGNNANSTAAVRIC